MAKQVSLLALSLVLASTSAFSVVTPSIGRISTTLFADTRRPFITGNWKLNPDTRDEAIQLAKEIASHVTPNLGHDVALFVPFPFIECVQHAVGDKFPIGAEVRTS